jgi:hypothetical protein
MIAAHLIAGHPRGGRLGRTGGNGRHHGP